MKDKIYLVSDKTKNSLKVKTYLTKKIEITSLKKSNIVIVLGGDGFMLQTLKKLYKFKKPFYGINSGNYGFLMNKFSIKNFLRKLKTSNSIRIHPLQMTVITKNNLIKKYKTKEIYKVLSEMKLFFDKKKLLNKNKLIKT